jgi:hypothetical protein
MSQLNRSLLDEATDPILDSLTQEQDSDVEGLIEKKFRRRDVAADLKAAWRLKLLLSEQSKQKFVLMLGLSFVYFMAEISIGVYASSLALIADAFHVLTDVVALAIGYYAAKVTNMFLAFLNPLFLSFLQSQSIYLSIAICLSLRLFRVSNQADDRRIVCARGAKLDANSTSRIQKIFSSSFIKYRIHKNA